MSNSIQLFEKQSMNIVKEANILTPEDLQVITDLSKELNQTYQTVQIFRTRTEMDISVLNDLEYPTPDAKFWQAVREQNVMFTELVRLSFQYRRNNIEITRLINDGAKLAEGYEKDLLCIDIEEKEFNRIEMERVAKDRIREIGQWHDIMTNLRPQLRCGDTNVDEHQLLSYTQRFIQAYAVAQETDKDVDSYRNLHAQLDMALKTCRDRGILEKVLLPFIDHPMITQMFPEEIARLTENKMGTKLQKLAS